MNSKVVNSAIWYTGTQFFIKGMGFLTIPIFTRMLDTNDYGIISLYGTWLGIFSAIIGLGLHLSIARGKIEFKEDYNEFVSSILFLITILFLVFSFFGIIFLKDFSKILEMPKKLTVLMLIQAYIGLVINVIIEKSRFEYKYKKASLIIISNYLIGLISSLIFIIYIYPNSRYFGKIIGAFLPELVLGLFFVSYILIKDKCLFNKKYWKFALAFSVPLTLGSISYIINNQFDRILINKYLGASETGIYSFSYNIALILIILSTSVKQAFNPWIYEKMDEGDLEPVRKSSEQIMWLFSFLYVIVLFISPEVVRILAPKEYWSGLSIIPLILLGSHFQMLSQFEITTLMFLKKTIWNMIIAVLGAGINIFLNIKYIPIYGIMGAAGATTFTYFVMFILYYIVNNSVINIKIFQIKKYVLSILFVSLFTMIFLILKENFKIRILINIFFTFYIFIKKIKGIKQFIKRSKNDYKS